MRRKIRVIAIARIGIAFAVLAAMRKYSLGILVFTMVAACSSQRVSQVDEDAAPDLAVDSRPPPEPDLQPVDPDGSPDSHRADATPPVTDPDVAKCVKQVSGRCQCAGECADGFGTSVWYQRTDGPFPGTMDPPDELLDVAVAKHYCSICVNCKESWEIKNHEGSGWIEVMAEQMCRRIVDKNRACNDCLDTWWGGAG